MFFKKNAFSYVCWAMMSLLVLVMISLWGMIMSRMYAKDSIVIAVLLIVACFGLAYGVYKVIDILLKHCRTINLDYFNSRTSIAEELIIVGLLLVAFFTVRVYMMSILAVDTAYFMMTHVSDTTSQSVEFVQGSVYYYCLLLRGMYRIFGNHLIVGVQLQMILQVLSIVFVYLAVRTLTNKLVAMLVLLVLCLSSTSIDAGLSYSPQMLYLCLFSLVFWMCSEYLKRIGKCASDWKMWIITLIVGISVGFVCYVDITGILLILLMIGMFVISCEPWEQKYVYLHFCGFVLAVFAMFFGAVYIDSLITGTQFTNVLHAWSVLYSGWGVKADVIIKKQSEDFMILPLFILLGVFSFWRRKGRQVFVPFILMVSGMSLLYCGGITGYNMQGDYLLYVLMVVLAAVSASELFYYSDLVVEEVEQEYVQEPVREYVQEPVREYVQEPVQEVVQEPVREYVQEPVREVVQELVREYVQEPVPEVVQELVQTIVLEPEVQENVTVNNVKENRGIAELERKNKHKQEENNMIENPLPIPKKKEKRVMDYAFQPESFEMMFDIRVSEKDDFDI